MSRSMLLRGCFLAAKKVALALDMLIRTRYPHDELHVVGFAYYAREIAPTALATLTGTATSTARTSSTGCSWRARCWAQPRREQVDRHRHGRRADRALRERPGRIQLPADAPDDPRDAQGGRPLHARGHHDQHLHARAVTAAGRVRRPHDAMNRGRAFYADPDELGEYVLVDYVNRRQRRD